MRRRWFGGDKFQFSSIPLVMVVFGTWAISNEFASCGLSLWQSMVSNLQDGIWFCGFPLFIMNQLFEAVLFLTPTSKRVLRFYANRFNDDHSVR